MGPIVERTDCPAAPPEMADVTPPPFGDLEVPKEVYSAMLERQEPFAGSRIELPWHLYTPEQASSGGSELFPVIISLHGGYGRGDEDFHILHDGVPFMLGSTNGLLTEENRAKYPAYIVIPHCVESAGCQFYGNEWASSGGANFQVQAEPSRYGSALIELIEHVVETYQVDPARIYVTGVSMGGGGTWELVQRRPDLIAAAFPQAGHTPAQQFLDDIAASKVPVWAFSSTGDNVNSWRDTDSAVEHISSQGGCAWVTKFENIEHSHLLWQRAFLEPGLWPWVFAQKQPRAGDVLSNIESLTLSGSDEE